MRYVSIDIETTGLDPKTCQLIELAMVIEDTNVNPLPPVEELPYHRQVFRPEIIQGEPYALSMHPELLREMDGITPGLEEARWSLVRDWLEDQFPDTPKIVAAGANVGIFDLQFFPKRVRALFHHRTIEVGSVFFDVTKGGAQGLPTLLGREPAHTALEDARDVITVLRRKYQELEAEGPTPASQDPGQEAEPPSQHIVIELPENTDEDKAHCRYSPGWATYLSHQLNRQYASRVTVRKNRKKKVVIAACSGTISDEIYEALPQLYTDWRLEDES